MSIILTAFLAGSALAKIDIASLELQSRAEALQPRRAVAASVRRPAAVRLARATPTMDLDAITTICRAAGSQPDPRGFLAVLGRAYSMSAEQSAQLNSSCAAYLAGRADARRSSR